MRLPPATAPTVIASLAIVGFAALTVFFSVPAHADGCSRPLVLVSWYGKETCHGRPPGHGKGFCETAAGVAYDGTQWLVANKALKFGTRIRFTYNGRSIVAPVLDRGPYSPGRVFDLSRPVAAALGIIDAGVVRVCAERLP